MATQETTPGSQTEESNALDLPSAYDIRDYVLQRPSQQTNSEAFSSEEACSIPCSSDVDPDSSNLNTEQNDSWTSENFWFYPSVKGQPETKEEDDGLRKSLDKFYEVFGNPQPASGNSLSTSVCQCLSQKINELKDQENQTYTLRSFQMARVIFNQNGCSILQKHSRDAHFYPVREGSESCALEKVILLAAEARILQIHPRESFPTAVSLHGAFTEDSRIRILPWLLFSLGLLQHLQLNVRCLKHTLLFHENVIHVYSSHESVLVTLQWDAPGILINACHADSLEGVWSIWNKVWSSQMFWFRNTWELGCSA
uniref:Shieldin complex subunit 1 n=1 Tax=Bos indicus x Bos taurus TaxID=30522 RepID=A0A4W2FSR7_BOBOX